MANLSGCQQQAVAHAIDADVVADGGEVLRSFADERANQILRHAAQSETANHDRRAVEDVADGFIGIGYYFVHRARDSK